MTTYIPFTPNLKAAPPWQGQFVLDGETYLGTVTWNFFGQRFYISFAKQNQPPVAYVPLVGSPLDADIPLAPWAFSQSTVLYRSDTGNFEVAP